MIVPVSGGALSLGACLASDPVLFGSELLAPLGVGFDDLVHGDDPFPLGGIGEFDDFHGIGRRPRRNGESDDHET